MQAIKIENQGVLRARLNQAISYKKDGVEILVPAGTEILVDISKEAALIGADHVHIEIGEFEALL